MGSAGKWPFFAISFNTLGHTYDATVVCVVNAKNGKCREFFITATPVTESPWKMPANRSWITSSYLSFDTD